jgi:hypothetical protein
MDEVGAAGVSKTTHDRAMGTGTGRQSRFQGTGFKVSEVSKLKNRAKAKAGAHQLRPFEMHLETLSV